MDNDQFLEQRPSGATPVSTHSSSTKLASGVLLVQRGTSGVLMDFDRGHFYGLDPIGCRMLSKTLEGGPNAAAIAMARLYSVEAEPVRQDLARFLDALHERGLVDSPGHAVPSRHRLGSGDRWTFSVVLRLVLELVRCWQRKRPVGSNAFAVLPGRRSMDLLLLLCWLSVKLVGWNAAIALWQTRGHHRVTPSAEAIARLVDGAVQEATARQILVPVACKERSLLGFHLLRCWNQLPATLVVGVDLHPFRAHAWVECAEHMTDDPSHCQLYSPVIQYC